MTPIQSLFPKSAEILGSLSVEQLNTFNAEVAEIQARLTAQAQGNQAQANDLTSFEPRIKTLETQLAAQSNLQEQIEQQTATINALKKQVQTVIDENTQLKAFETAQQAATNVSPTTDTTNAQAANPDPVTAAILAAHRANGGLFKA